LVKYALPYSPSMQPSDMYEDSRVFLVHTHACNDGLDRAAGDTETESERH
jgi:hypothetical protein